MIDTVTGAPVAHADGGATADAIVLLWTPAVLAAVVPAAAYLCLVHRLRHQRRRRWSTARTASFLCGCALVGVALSPLVDAAARDGATGHMVQHLSLAMYAPVGLVLGAPVTLLLGAASLDRRRRIRRLLHLPVVRVPTHLTVATVLNAAGPFVLYLTPLYALSSRHDVVHHLVHVHFLLAGYVFAWAVAGTDPAARRPGTGWRVTALVGAGGSHAFLAKLLYSRAGGWPPDAAVTAAEMERAAQWMYWGGHLAEIALLVALFAAWYRRAPRLDPAAGPRPRPAQAMVTGSPTRTVPGATTVA